MALTFSRLFCFLSSFRIPHASVLLVSLHRRYIFCSYDVFAMEYEQNDKCQLAML